MEEPMETKLLNENEIDEAVDILKNGGLVAIPTETVYGLAANALSPDAVKGIFKAKGRPGDNPLIVHIAELQDIERYALSCALPKSAKLLAELFWPGALTVILPKTVKVPDAVSAGLSTVAIRMPAHETARKIIKAAGVPLAAPSANLSGSPSPTTAQHVLQDLNGRIQAVLDGGACSVGVESTVLSLAGSVPRLLRPGAVTLEQLREALGKVEVDSAVMNELKKGEAASSPGMKYKHYSPKANVILVKSDDSEYYELVNSKKGGNAVALCYNEDVNNILIPVVMFGSRENPCEQAEKIFDALRRIDSVYRDFTVYARCPETDGIGLAVYNRLIRAAGFEVITL